MKRTIAMIVGLGLVLSLPLFAQLTEADVPYVDIAEAQKELAEVEKQIVSYTESYEKAAAENKEFISKYNESLTLYAELEKVFEQTRSQKFELEQNMDQIVDKGLRAKVQESLKKNKAATEAAGKQMSGINRDSKDTLEKIRSSKYTMEMSFLVASRKKDRKAFLEAAIAKTQKQIEQFTKQMAEFDAFFTSAEAQKLRLNINL